MGQNHLAEDPFLFVWEPLVLLVHLVCKMMRVDPVCDGVDKVKTTTKKIRALLLKVPVSRTISVASAFQASFLHVVYSMQACNVDTMQENIDVFDGTEFNRIYHHFYSFVLLSRNSALNSGRAWESRASAGASGRQFCGPGAARASSGSRVVSQIETRFLCRI